MKWQFYLSVAFLLFIMNARSQPPAHTGRFSPYIDNNVNGFWEYLPRNYQTDVQTRYPLLIFIHGAGEQGSTTDTPTLNKILRAGPPRLINSGNFPDSFYVGGQWHKFIVISPQIKVGISGVNSIVEPSTIEAVIQYARSTYRVDDNRIYLCGLSMGGGAVWDYASSSITAAHKLAAIIVATGAADLSQERANNIAQGDLPVLATHNRNDNLIAVSRTEANIAAIKNYSPAIYPGPKAIYWNTGGHNVWTRTYENILPGTSPNGNLTDTLGVNAYEWALQYFRPSVILASTWQSFTVRAQNSAAVLTWIMSRTANVKEFIVEKSRDGIQWMQMATVKAQQAQQYEFTDASPGTGTIYYRIRATAYNNGITYSPVKTFNANKTQQVLIYPNPFAGELRIDAKLPSTAIVVKLTDAMGRTIVSQKHEAGSIQGEIVINNLERLSPGTYILTIGDVQGQILYRRQLLRR